jgi:hypothetical protein
VRRILSLENRNDNWTQLLIYLTNDGICSGFVNCSRRRLMDFLNNVSTCKSEDSSGDYIRIKEARIDCLNRRESAEVASISKDDILFIKPVGHKSSPFMLKRPPVIRLHFPSYILAGRIHNHLGSHRKSALDSVLDFFPINDVDITLRASNFKHKAPYVIVNKNHISFIEEIGTHRVALHD